MYKNNKNHFPNINANRVRTVNRKRSQRWISAETRLFNKYGMNSHYLNMYVL